MQISINKYSQCYNSNNSNNIIVFHIIFRRLPGVRGSLYIEILSSLYFYYPLLRILVPIEIIYIRHQSLFMITTVSRGLITFNKKSEYE